MRRYAITMFGLAGAIAFAQSNPAYIQFTPSAVKGALYKPDSGPAPHVAILLMHRTANFLSHIGATGTLEARLPGTGDESPVRQ